MDTEHEFRLALMALAEQLTPLHELVLGEVNYFLRQGFTVEQARAMAAAEFVSVLGLRILNNATPPDDERPASGG